MRNGFLTYLLISVVLGSVCRAELQVNTHTSGEQRNADIAVDSLGNFVVVWSSYGQDGSSNGVFAQRFDPNFSPVGEESGVNTTTVGNQTEPAVGMDAEGNFVVTWHGPGLVELEREDIFARRFDPNGGALGDEFPVNSHTVDSQLFPSVAVNDDGTFVVVWESVNFGAEGERQYAANYMTAMA
jgi:hypothetical protein